MKKHRLFLFAGLLIVLFFCGCTITTTRPIEPTFNNINIVEKTIDSLIQCEDVVFGGNETKTNGKATTDLLVEIINPENFPEDEIQLREKGEQIAKIAKAALVGQSSFNTYTVMFRKVKNSGIGVISSSNYKGVVFKSEQLK
jgi:hypothetical protein